MDSQIELIETKISGFIEKTYGNGKKKIIKLASSDLEKMKVKLSYTCKIEEKSSLRSVCVKLTRLTPAEIEKYTCHKEVKKYSLRKRIHKRKADPLENPAKRVCCQIAHRNQKPEFVAAKVSEVKVDTLVLANMKHFSPWPAIVTSVVNLKTTTNVNISFFGDATNGTVKISQIDLIEPNRELIKHLLTKKIIHYSKAVLEMETMANLPRSLSLLGWCFFCSSYKNILCNLQCEHFPFLKI